MNVDPPLGAISAPPLVPDEPIDLMQLSRLARGERKIMREVLKLFDLQAEVLTSRMISEAPKEAAARAHTLAASARSVGAWKVAEAAAAFKDAANEGGPIVLAPIMRRLSTAVSEAHGAIESFLSNPAMREAAVSDTGHR